MHLTVTANVCTEWTSRRLGPHLGSFEGAIRRPITARERRRSASRGLLVTARSTDDRARLHMLEGTISRPATHFCKVPSSSLQSYSAVATYRPGVGLREFPPSSRCSGSLSFACRKLARRRLLSSSASLLRRPTSTRAAARRLCTTWARLTGDGVWGCAGSVSIRTMVPTGAEQY